MGMRDKEEGKMERGRDRETNKKTDRNEGVGRPTKMFSGTTGSTLQMTSQCLRTLSQ